jgi:hypothetical protein
VFKTELDLFELETIENLRIFLESTPDGWWMSASRYLHPEIERYDDIEPEIHNVIFAKIEEIIGSEFNSIIEYVRREFNGHKVYDYRKDMDVLVVDGSLTRYRKNQGLSKHTDRCKEAPNCDLTAILYVNDNYEGGELLVDGLKPIKMQSGQVALIGGDIAHEAAILKSGVKYLISWRFRLETK